MEENTTYSLASELLHETKLSARRWFIAFIVVLVLWFSTIGLFVWYISLPVEEEITETTTQTAEEVDNSTITQTIGGK